MPSIKALEEQGRALSEKQKTLVLDDERPWSDKKSEYDKLDADIKTILEQRNAQKAVDSDPFGGAEAAAESAPSVPVVAKSIEQQIADNPAYKAAVSAKDSGEKFAANLDLKAVVLQSGQGVGSVVPDYQVGVVQTLFRRLTVADLMPNSTTSAASLIYMQETAVTNAAAAVAEGAAKPQSDITLAQVTETVRKIANTAKVSDEMISDAGFVAGYIQGRLVLFVQLAEEDQLLNGNGTAPNLRGLLNRTGLATAVAVPGTPTQTDRIDSIYSQISAIRSTAFLEPDGIVMNPTDWKTIRLNKDANNQYFGGGPFTGAYGVGAMPEDHGHLGENPDLWGCRVVVTPAIAAGTALVGAFGTAAQVFRRSGITVEMTNSNEDDFLKNLVAMRAEERLALACYRPGAFGKVTGL
jgi:HK97 family phage major capsid protein